MTSIPQIYNSTTSTYEQIDAGAVGLTDGSNRLMAGQIYNLANLTRSMCPSGHLTIGDLDYTYMSTNPNKVKFLTEDIALVNGYKGIISAGTIVSISNPPSDVSREDLLFYEMYLNLNGIPTFSIREVDGVNFTTYPEGIDNTALVKARGGSTTDTTYTYSLSATDKGLFVAGDGSSNAKTALKSLDGYSYCIGLFRIHRRPSCGMMSTNEYDKVSSLGNIALVKARSSQQRVSHSGDTVTTKIEGKTLVNLLGDVGNCESLTGWTSYSSTLDTSIKLFGSVSHKFNASTSAPSTHKDMVCDQTHKYLISGYANISSYTNGSIELNATDYGNYLHSTLVAFDTTKLNQWQRKSVIITGKLNGGFKLMFGITQNYSTLIANFDGIAVYDLTAIYGAGNEPSDIPTLERALPYVNGVKSASSVSLKSCGKNTFNKDTKVIFNYGSSIATSLPTGIKVSNTTGNAYNYVSYVLGLKPNTSYTLYKNSNRITGTTGGAINLYLGKTTSELLGGSINHAGTTVTFTTSNTGFVCILFYSTQNANEIGEVDYTNIQLEEGSSATAYESYNESSIILPAEISDLKQIGAVKDDIVLQTGDWSKRISDVVVLDGSPSWELEANATGYKIAKLLSQSYLSNSVNFKNTALKYNGIQLLSLPNSTVTGSDQFIQRGSDTVLYVSVSNTDTGFYDGVTPSTNEIKAYFFGYKLCNSDGTAWDGTSTKYWKKITDGTGITSTLPTASYAGYTPYKMIYQLATPIVTNIKDKLEGRNYYNVGYNGVSLDQVSRIDGNLVSVPNLVTNADFSSGTTGWTANESTISAASNILANTANGVSAFPQTLSSSLVGTIGNKFYIRFKGRVTNTACSYLRLGLFGSTSGEAVATLSNPLQNNWYNVSVVVNTSGFVGSLRIYARHGYADASTANGKVMEVQQVYSLDLTAIFGAGNEPSQAWCDQYLTFGTNYALYSPANTTALKVVNDGGDKLSSVQGNVGIISASKYRSDKLYSLMYSLAQGDYTYPDITVVAGTVTSTIVNSASVGSLVLADSDIKYKSNGDGSNTYATFTTSGTASNLLIGSVASITFTSVTGLQLNDRLYDSAYPTIQITVIGISGTTVTFITNGLASLPGSVTTGRAYVRIPSRSDLLLSDIVDTKDIQPLLHQVSLVGYNYDTLLTENWDRLTRNEL